MIVSLGLMLVYFLVAALVLYAIYLILGLIKVIPESVKVIIVIIIFILMIGFAVANYDTLLGS